MFELKRLSRDGVAAALKKAERYRLLNQPWEAESICRDVLEVDPTHQEALVVLLLALTDQFGAEPGEEMEAARGLLPRLEGEYRRLYYEGIISERRAKKVLETGGPQVSTSIYKLLRNAMDLYERAAKVRPPGDDDPLLRWNTCARLLMKHAYLQPSSAEERTELLLE